MISADLQARLERRAKATGQSPESLMEQLIRAGLGGDGRGRALHVTTPVNALVEGIYQENVSIAEVLEHGDFGLGTFNHLDGEMVVLDGVVYQLKSDGQAYQVAPETHTPYACVNFFSPDSAEDIEQALDFKGLTELLERMLPSSNMIYAIRIDGEFGYIRTRSVPRQECYRPLVEVAREQPEFEYRDVAGVMTGYWTPTFMEALSVPGFHLHFIDERRERGGHLLACETRSMRVAIQHLPRLEVGLPVSLDYLTAEFTRNLGADLEEAETSQK